MRATRHAVTAVLILWMLLAPGFAQTQSVKMSRIGVLCPTQCVPTHYLWTPFLQGLRDFGWVEGQNFVFEFRHAMGRAEQLSTLAAELVNSRVDVLVAPSPATAHALRQATQMIPIVFAGVGDPVQTGLVATLARPGGNMTGIALFAGPGLDGKRVEMVRQTVPSATRIAVLSVPTNEPYNAKALLEIADAGRTLGVEVRVINVRGGDDLEGALATMAKERIPVLLVLGSPLTTAHAARIGELSLRQRVAAFTSAPDLTASGYLVGFGPSFADTFRRIGYFIDRILRGTRPGDLPVEQPTTFQLVINLKTAKRLDLSIPQALLVRADKVID